MAVDMTEGLVVQLLQRNLDQGAQILKEHAALKAAFTAHVKEEQTLVKSLSSAFAKRPDGSPDFEGHEAYHSAVIAESRERALFYRELRQELIKKGVWGVVMILGALITYWWSGQVSGR